MATELPLRIVELPAGYCVRCLCGAESAIIKPASAHGEIIRAARGFGITNRDTSGDLSPAAILRMVVHARSCLRAQNASAESAAPATT